jgi:hypothetical protein
MGRFMRRPNSFDAFTADPADKAGIRVFSGVSAVAGAIHRVLPLAGLLVLLLIAG